MLTLVDQHMALEVGMVGCKGMVGVMIAIGVNISPFRAVVQGSGSALRMTAAAFRKEFRQGLSMQREVHFYTRELISQIAQTAACNHFHRVEEQLARRLLMTRDRMGSDYFSLIHEFPENMLGLRHVGVTKAAYQLKQRQLIDYTRGNIVILDAHGLASSACLCYESANAKDIYGKA